MAAPDRFAASVTDRAHTRLTRVGTSVAPGGGDWRGPFSFVQLADTQFGLLPAMKKLWWVRWLKTLSFGWIDFNVPEDAAPELDDDEAYAKELAFAEKSVAHVNSMTPAPAFVVVCGDLVNAFPTQTALQQDQVADFKRIFSTIREDIPCVCVCGNHDLGDRPNAATVDLFRRRFGDDYFSFWAGGVKFLVLNSQLWKDATDAQELAEAQDEWLRAELGKNEKAQHLIVFSHISPFIESQDERSAYFNLEMSVRMRLLGDLADAGCKAWFSGHYHRNSVGLYTHTDGETQIEVVTSCAVGATLRSKPAGAGGDPLGLSGMQAVELDESTSGLRVVHVDTDSITHDWVAISDM